MLILILLYYKSSNKLIAMLRKSVNLTNIIDREDENFLPDPLTNQIDGVIQALLFYVNRKERNSSDSGLGDGGMVSRLEACLVDILSGKWCE